MTRRAEEFRPDENNEKELAKEILTTPIYPEGNKEPEESFEQVLEGKKFEQGVADLLRATLAVVRITGKRTSGQQTRLQLATALQVTQTLRADYADYAGELRRELTNIEDTHEKAITELDIRRSEEAIKNLDTVDELYRKLARKMGIELKQPAISR